MKRLINSGLYHAIQSLSVVEELRYKRHARLKTSSHVLLQAETHVEEEDIMNSDKAGVQRKHKRSFYAFLPLIGKIATIAVEVLGSHLQKKRKKAMIKAVNELQSKQFLTRNQLYKLEKDFLMYGKYDVQSTDGLIHVLKNLHNRTVYLENMINGNNANAMLQYVGDTRGIEVFAHQVNLCAGHERKIPKNSRKFDS